MEYERRSGQAVISELLRGFKDWVRLNDQRFKDDGLQYEVFETPADIDKPAMYIDFDSPGFVSRITIWDMGECHLEALDIDTGTTVMSSHIEVEDADGFDDRFSEFFETMRSMHELR